MKLLDDAGVTEAAISKALFELRVEKSRINAIIRTLQEADRDPHASYHEYCDAEGNFDEDPNVRAT